MTQTVRHYESKLPITHREFYEMIAGIKTEELEGRNGELEGGNLRLLQISHSGTRTIYSKYNGGRINFTYPGKSDVPIEIWADSKNYHKYLRRGLERFLEKFLKSGLQEITQEATV